MKKRIISILIITCILLATLPVKTLADSGDIFIANITVGSDNAVPCTFKVLTEPTDSKNGTVQIGYDWTAINTATQGELIIPEQVKRVKNGVELTYDVTVIGYKAFQGCQNLSGNLIIPSTITAIGTSAFCDCTGLNGTLTIPSTVTEIGNQAFYNCSNLTGNLVIPPLVTTIQYGTFYNCKGLTGALSIPSNVKTIGESAFYGCEGFTGNLTIPSTVIDIGSKAFYNCSNLTGALSIPSNVKTIGESAFYGCEGFTGNLTIPKTVTSIGTFAFSKCRKLSSFQFEEGTSITTIANGIFRDCNGLTGNLEIPSGFTSIGSEAFSGCTGLNGNLVIPSTVTMIGDYAFYNCKELTGNLTIPSGVKTIGHSVFYGCEGFTGNLNIPKTVTSIGTYAFSKCKNLSSFQFEEGTSITTIAIGTFSDCSGLTGNLEIPSGVKTIGNSAFSGCTGFTGNLTIPSTVTTIGDSAFNNCSGLTGNLEIPSGVTIIKNSAFSGCTGFTGPLSIPSTVTTIGSYAFTNCRNLSSLQFEPGINIDTIAEGAFKGCSELTGSLIIPDKVTKIGGSAFEDCIKLTGPLTIPDSVTTIGNKAFGNCTALAGKLTIPENVTAIGSQAFYNCKLESVAFLSTTAPTVNANSFNGTYPIYYPSDGNGYDGSIWTYYSGRMVSDKEEKPDVIFTATGPDTGTLSGVDSGMKYKINDGEWKNIDSNDVINLTGLTICTITIVKKGDGSNTKDSDPQTITVTKAATPTAGKVDCSTIANNNGKLTGLTTSMEYKLSTDSEWKAVTGSEITGLDAGTYNVRMKASGTVLASYIQTITIEAYNATQEAKPSVTFTATGSDTGFLSGVASGMKYRINDGEWKDISSNDNISLSGLTACTITIVKKGNGTTTTDSEPQTITVTKEATPTAGKVDCSTIANNNGKLIGVTTSMEYKLSTDSEWKAVAGNEVIGLDAGTYHVRVKASGAVLASDIQSITIEAYNAAQEPVPSVTFTATGSDTGFLSGVASGMKYRINDGEWKDVNSNDNISLSGLTACTITVVKKGNGSTTTDSNPQTITVTKAATPTAGKVDCSTIANNNGKLTGLTTSMEYKLSTDSEWKAVAGNEVIGLDAGTYHVRVKASGTVLASDIQSITIAAYNATQEAKPSVTFTATGSDTGVLLGVASGMKYRINDGEWKDINSNDNISLSGLTACTITIVKKGNGSTTMDSNPQTITVTKAATPTAGKVDCTTIDNNNGKLTGLTNSMEYKLSTDSEWKVVIGSEITGLDAGTYHVRVKASGAVLASDIQTITIAAYNAAQEPVPSVTFTATGPDTGVLSGVDSGMKYRINDGEWKDINSNDSISLSGLTACTITVVKKGNGSTTTDSAPQTITVTKAATPTAGKVDCTTIDNNNGKLTGLTASMEYKLSTDSEWKEVTGNEMTGLDAGTYHVRVKASGTVLASDIQIITIEAYTDTGTQEPEPTDEQESEPPIEREPKPTAIFNATGTHEGTLSNVTEGMKYSLDVGTSWQNISGTTINITGVTTEGCIFIYHPGNDITTIASDIQVITVTRAVTPSVIKSDCATIANNDGKLIGVTPAMEYKLSTDSEWKAVTGNIIYGLASGTYNVRVKASGTVLASDIQTIMIESYIAKKEFTPDLTFTATGADTGILSGTASGMKYKINDEDWNYITSNDDISLSGLSACTITVVRRGNGSTTIDSEPQTITVTKAAAPSIGKADCTTTANNDGKLTGLTTSMEYKLSTDSDWKAVTGSEITGLASGTYNVRIKTSGIVLASDIQSITIEAYREPVTEIQNGSSVTGKDLDKLISSGKTLTVNGDNGAKLVFSSDALKGIKGQNLAEIMAEIKDVSSAYQEKLPGKLVFSIMVSSGNDTISNIGGSVTNYLPYELKKGERVKDVTVWHLASDGTMTEIPCTYDSAAKLAAFTVPHFSLYVVGVADAEPWVNLFSDVNTNDWFYSAVEFVNRNSLFLGTSASNFSPASPMTRAMLWTVLGRLNGSSLSGSDAFNAARIWAMGVGITDGTNPDANITREQVVTILWRYAGSPKAGSNLSNFSDAGSVASYAVNAMAWAVENGIIAGSNGALMPQDNATRAQVAAILQRFINGAAR